MQSCGVWDKPSHRTVSLRGCSPRGGAEARSGEEEGGPWVLLGCRRAGPREPRTPHLTGILWEQEERIALPGARVRAR